LAVPGNHDLARPDDEEDPALINLQYLWDRQVVQNPFWNNAGSEQRKIVDKAFANYTTWWDGLLVPKPTIYRPGVLPGDFSATIEKDGRKLGIIGLNTSFLQLQDGNSQGKLAVDVRQFHEACGGHGPDWAKKHDACLLLTHHPPSWLNEQAQDHLDGEIYRPHRFAVHLFGHLHEPELRIVAVGGAEARRRLQGCSLFAVEGWGEQGNQERIHGYSVGQLRIDGDVAELRIWPRQATRRQGGWFIDRDTSFALPKDGFATEATPVNLLHPRIPSELEVTDEQQKAEAAKDAFALALAAWHSDGIPESGRKLDWFYRYRSSLDLHVKALVFLLQSESFSAEESFPFNILPSLLRQAPDNTRTRWINAVDPTVCLQTLDRIIELSQAEKLDKSVASSIVSDICSASSLRVQQELIVKLENLQPESNPGEALLAQAYKSSPVPNEATLAYLQDVSLREIADVVRLAIVYRILQYYQRALPPYIRGDQQTESAIRDWRTSLPVHLLEKAPFRDAVFRYLDEASESRQGGPFTEYKLQLLEMLHEYDPNRTIEALWEMVRLDLFYIGHTTRETIQLLRVYDPERTVQEVVGTLKGQERYYSTESIELLESLEEREADDLLIDNIRRYAVKFTGGSKNWTGGGLQYWRKSLMYTVEAAVRRELSTVKPHLITIVLRHEPANVKLGCIRALIVLGSEEELWPIVLQLLNDRSSQVRNTCVRQLSKMKQYQHRTVEKLAESFDEASAPK
jgi:hypothetical protein